MNAISSAAPCHIRISWDDEQESRVPVIAWTLDNEGVPLPWYLWNGDIFSLVADPELPEGAFAVELMNGPA